MIIDCHVHTSPTPDSKEDFLKNLDTAGVDRAVLLSYYPATYLKNISTGATAFDVLTPQQALDDVMEWAAFSDRVIPFYWIDPLEEDALEQVDRAVEAGIAGFKTICFRYFPGDERPMEVWRRIAEHGKPMLFHSGILYGNTPSSNYNRPANFEALFDIPNLRFAMAHVSWPWHDECIAVYGHWRSRKRNGTTTAEMFIDTTPGTPKIYRHEVLSKLYTIGYDIEDNIIFGTDCHNKFSSDYAISIMETDRGIMDAIGMTEEQREKYYYKNLLRWLGE